MRSSRLRAKSQFTEMIARGDMPVGGFVTSSDPHVTALFGAVGYDFVIIDAEHGIFGPREVLDHVHAAERSGVTPIVRIIEGSPVLVQQVLDMGASGVVIPKAEDADRLASLVRASRYVPGGRGYCPSVPAADWSRSNWASYSSHANENVSVIPLIETRRGVENAAEIAGVEGVDFVFFGVADLSQDLGIDLDADRDQIAEHWSLVRDAVHAAGKFVGCPLNFGLTGADFGTATGDLGSLRAAIDKQLSEIRARARH